jgi:hypothetical protein
MADTGTGFLRCRFHLTCIRTRILERQNMLQISQVFVPWALRQDQAVLPFKDSKGGTWPLELPDFRLTLF